MSSTVHREHSDCRSPFHTSHFWMHGYTYCMSSISHTCIFSKSILRWDKGHSTLSHKRFAPKAAKETETTESVIPCNSTKLQLRAEACWQFRALQTTTCKDELFCKAKCWPQAWRTLLQRQIAVALLFSIWTLGNLQVETITMISSEITGAGFAVMNPKIRQPQG